VTSRKTRCSTILIAGTLVVLVPALLFEARERVEEEKKRGSEVNADTSPASRLGTANFYCTTLPVAVFAMNQRGR